MPMIQFVCPEDHDSEHFYHASSIPDTILCDECGVESTRDLNPHLTRPASNGFLIPIVVDIETETGRPSFPGSVNDPVEKGCNRIEIRSMREYDKFRHSMDKKESDSTHARAIIERDHLNHETRQRREAIDSEMDRRGITSSRMRDIARSILDKRREAKYTKILNRGAGFHNRALDFDSKDKQTINHYER